MANDKHRPARVARYALVFRKKECNLVDGLEGLPALSGSTEVIVNNSRQAPGRTVPQVQHAATGRQRQGFEPCEYFSCKQSITAIWN